MLIFKSNIISQKMGYIYFLVLFLFLNSAFSQDIFMNSSHKRPVKLGDRVTLTCKLSDLVIAGNAFIFKRDETMISENCKVYEKDLYIMKCNNKTEYQLIIKSMSWADKGKWYCLYTSVVATIDLEIYVAPEISMSIFAKPKKMLSNNLGPAAFPSKHLIYPQVEGTGLIVNPYDLRDELSVNLICKSGCGYPMMYHAFNFKNSSNFSLQLDHKTLNYESKECKNIPEKKMFSATSTLEFNCSSWKLYGLLNLTCSAVHPIHKRNELSMMISEEHIFILCPTEPIEWWKMTYGEKINTGIGCFIAVMLILYFFLLVCRWKSHKYNDIDDPCQGGLTSANNDSAAFKTRGYRV